ncbi:MAG: T9SS type A sorting domain-containing protein [Candidatus Marinimicrobia bacterium]|nr:T9SS type A sorting domain-containing protein [Candidatus Neomarinimicrobiota bacterium]
MKNSMFSIKILFLFSLTFILLSFFSNVQAQWTDDFESYSTGSWPTTWVADGNATDNSKNYVDNTVNYQGQKSLRLFGTIGGCWGALAYHPIVISPPYEIELAVRNGNENLSGCHPDRADIALRKGTHWSNPSRSFISFKGDGTILSGGGGVTLGNYTKLSWYLIKIQYERPSSSEVKISYWINGIYKGSETLTAIEDEDQLTNLQLDVQEGTAWFDNICLEESQHITGIKKHEVTIPNILYLYQNYPNPFNPTTIISYQLPKSSHVKLSIYDISGRLVETLVNDYKNVGYYSVEWNAKNVGSGIYLYRIDAGNFSSVKKCLAVK